ncbi:MAG: hypothetical protein A2X66_03580 [Ignavibacteria bacterium GWA2_54_16]|nr:MAG: hypothetical protein A2X66_03580 [Ignavibacteria bacterium GWA2_54_16]
MNNLLRCLFLLTAVLMSPLLAWAQDEESPPPSKALERVEQFKKIRLMEILALDEQTSIKFFARYGKHQRALQDLRRKQVQALVRVQALRKAKAADAEYAKVIGDLQSLEGEGRDAKLKYLEELHEILSNKQIAEYLVFETRFQQNLRDLIRDVRNKQAR